MMRSRRPILILVLAALLVACSAAAETPKPSPEQLEIWQDLTPEQREAILSMSPEEREAFMRSYSANGAAAEFPSERDSIAPMIIIPREQEVSALERQLAGEEPGELEELPGEGALFESEPEAAVGIREAFTNFLAESQPLTVDTALEQFGYELFAGAPTTFAPATDIPVGPEYIIGPGDEIRVQLYGKTNLTVNLQVDRDGQVTFPELGPITFAGLTFSEMKEFIAREVDERMIGVTASITMGRLRSIRVFVLGDVFQPGSYTVSGLTTLTNALIVSGGVQKVGSLRNVQLKRKGKLVATMDLYDLLLKGDTSKDTRLMPGDVIFVPPVGALVGVAGEVNRPAIYEIRGKLTAQQLLEMAGGLRPTAFSKLVQIERIENDSRVTFDFLLADAGKWTLKAGDMLMIYPILDVEEQVVYLEGNVHRPGKRQWSSGMRLSDLVAATSDLLPETHFGYGLVERENELSREPEYLAFDLGAILIDRDKDADLALKPRDRVFVFHRSHFREERKVEIRGRVQEAGEYSFRKDMRVLDLILAAGGLRRDAFLTEAELFRTDPVTLEVTKIALDLKRVLAEDLSQNITLQDLDELMIHSIWEFKSPEEVEILGEVNYPGVYPRFEGMRISDLIFAGGNLKEEAYRAQAELTRYNVIDGEYRELDHFPVNLDSILVGSRAADIYLQPYDRLLIRRITNWRAVEVVRVTGQVAFPGDYPIEEGERLSDLIERFGGFLDDAYLPAAALFREDVQELQQEQFDRMAAQLEADLTRAAVQITPGVDQREATKRAMALEAGRQLAAELRSAKATGRLVVNISSAEELRGTQYDLVLKDGDFIYIPMEPDYVIVLGQVYSPTAFQHQGKQSAGDYIKLAGGETRFADGDNTYVVRADGSVKHGKGTKLQPGDVVIVPESLERFSGMQFMLDLSAILYQLGLAAAAVYAIAK